MPIALLLVVAVELRSARIDVSLAPDGATVVASYRFDLGGAREFVLIRLPNQRLGDLGGAGLVARDAPGLVRISSSDSSEVVEVRYRVVGDLTRIPIPVPSIATARGAKAVEIAVSGLTSSVDLADAFPRLGLQGGLAVAVLANVPSLIRLPAAGAWSLIRSIDRLVIALVAAGTIGWFFRRRPLGPGPA